MVSYAKRASVSVRRSRLAVVSFGKIILDVLDAVPPSMSGVFISGLVNVLFVRVWVSVVPTTLPVTPWTPELGLSTSAPWARFDIVLLSASIVLFVSV